MTRKIRYLNTSTNYEFGTGFGYLVARDLINAVVAWNDDSTNNRFTCLAEAVRLREIKLYRAPGGSGGVADVIIFTWLGNRGPESRYEARGAYDKPPSMKVRPPPGSFANTWYSVEDPESYAQILCHFSIPQYCVVDITFDFTLDEASGTGSGIVEGTDPGAAGIWYPALDNCNTSGTVYNLYLHPDSLGYVIVTDPAPVKPVRRKKLEYITKNYELRYHRDVAFKLSQQSE